MVIAIVARSRPVNDQMRFAVIPSSDLLKFSEFVREYSEPIHVCPSDVVAECFKLLSICFDDAHTGYLDA